jgi:uncharacterized membrane protein HdeD (DUF308 family)
MTNPTPSGYTAPIRPWIPTMVLGVILFLLGAFIAVRPLFVHHPTTTAQWLDITFALVFMLRGVLNVKTALRRRENARMAQG